MAFYQFHKEQIIDASIDEVWNFISSPQNLKKITPKEMDFEILTPNLPDKIYEGMIISYSVKPLLGIPTNWVTEITHIKDKSYFVDEQRVGPYKLWHHQHIITPLYEGVSMKDIVSYQPPFGWLGNIANTLIIKHRLEKIFRYRGEVIKKIFPKK